MKITDTLRNIWYAATHANQLIDESDKYHRLLHFEETQEALLRDESGKGEDEIQKSCTLTPARDLPQGWYWEDYRNSGGGVGCLKAPDGSVHSIYVLKPYSTGAEEDLEYFDLYGDYEQVLPKTGKLSDLKAYAESEMKRNLLSRDEEKEWNPSPKYAQASDLPDGWQWVDYGDGSGHLQSPDGENFFGYDRQPYSFSGGIEYKVPEDGRYTAFWETMEDFKSYAESWVRNQYLPQQEIQSEQSCDRASEVVEQAYDYEPEL